MTIIGAQFMIIEYECLAFTARLDARVDVSETFSADQL